MNPFIENSCLTPKVSLNRMRFMSLGGGLKADEGLAGKTGLELVSAATFTKNISNFLRDQNFDTLEDENLNSFLSSIDKKAVLRFARNLAHLLLALKLGDDENRRQRLDWNDAEWDFWRDAKRVILCGGLTQGLLGHQIKLHIEEFFAEVGMPTAYEIEIPPDSRSLPLVGACRLLGDIFNVDSGLVFDFGHSYVKRCFAVFHEGVCRIRTLQKRRSEFMQLPPEGDVETAGFLHEFIVGTIMDSYSYVSEHRPELKLSDVLVLSMANYIQNGVLDATRGGYAKLRLICDNYETFLAEDLGRRLGACKKITVKIVHDGMSAAYALDCSPQENTIVLSLGTGLGIGFPPEEDRKKFNYVME